MKSVDYFRYNLPIINNIPADTKELVENEKIGFNFSDDTATIIAALSKEELISLRENVRKIFHEKFEISIIENQFDDILNKM
jgi:hypothetical protein